MSTPDVVISLWSRLRARVISITTSAGRAWTAHMLPATADAQALAQAALASSGSAIRATRRQAHRVVGLVAVRAEPGTGGHGRAHLLQALAVAHAQARAAEAARRAAAARALRLACTHRSLGRR